MRRVVITGAGTITSVGSDIPTFWDNIVAGRTGIKPITGIDNQTPVKVAAQIPDFDPTRRLEKKEAKRIAASKTKKAPAEEEPKKAPSKTDKPKAERKKK